ncbi:hypothetical protein [Arthrobacter sp. NEB 688]|uniref:hypothetical protein n=1 Tax=Arthrobacter sp. NEB 688 TaxID=904039 RepID=UPI001564F966|nr:hypothetical protein [Arthrobacter sp. NEB 688]QKE83830.1 hypothetical protein HL663_07685 [Arthrobacter sp. NEB 688]
MTRARVILVLAGAAVGAFLVTVAPAAVRWLLAVATPGADARREALPGWAPAAALLLCAAVVAALVLRRRRGRSG